MDSSSSDDDDQSRSTSAGGAQGCMTYKRLLCQYTTRNKMQLPFYLSRNEGAKHQPMYRSTVWINDVSYTSSNTFSQRDEAHMDASRVAYVAITQTMKDEAFHFIREDSILCKEILHEYANKMNVARPIYQAIRLRPWLYQSTCAFNDVIYTGEVSRKKKEAEQLAARAAALSLLDASESGRVIAEIVNAKIMLRAAKPKECSIQTGTMPDQVVQTGFSSEKDAQVNAPPGETQSSSEGYGLLYAYPECR